MLWYCWFWRPRNGKCENLFGWSNKCRHNLLIHACAKLPSPAPINTVPMLHQHLHHISASFWHLTFTQCCGSTKCCNNHLRMACTPGCLFTILSVMATRAIDVHPNGTDAGVYHTNLTIIVHPQGPGPIVRIPYYPWSNSITDCHQNDCHRF